MVTDYRNDINRHNILQCLGSRIEIYFENIEKNLENNNEEGAKIFIIQLQAIIDFIDGKKN